MSNSLDYKSELIRGEKGFLDALQKDAFTELRMKSYEQWKQAEAPTTRNEYWKYTRLAPLFKKTYSIIEKTESFSSDFLHSSDYYNLVFVNGVFETSASDIVDDGSVIIMDLLTAKAKHKVKVDGLIRQKNDVDYFTLLNDAFHQNGPFIQLGKNTILEKPVRILNISKGKDRLVNLKGFIYLEKGSSVKIIETWDHEHAEENLINSRLDIQVNENAKAELIKVESIGQNHLICQDFVEQKRDSLFSIHTISTEGKLIRNNLTIELDGENAECNLNGLYLTRGNEHVDNHTTVHHKVPNCLSKELYKGIVNDKSKAVFNGKVVVHKDAQKTNAFQSNANILLTNDSEIYSKPELEIYADDVKCSHGSTTGQLDEEALFYLESRGLGKNTARNLLLFAFAQEVLDLVPIEEFKDRIMTHLGDRYKVVQND